MRSWLLDLGDLAGHGSLRAGRYEHIAEALVNEGHQVLRWAPTDLFASRELASATEKRIRVARNYAVQFVHSGGEHHPLDVAHGLANRLLARHLRKRMERESTPDVIVAAIPSLEWAATAIEFGRSRGVPVVVDVCKTWPEIELPARLKFAERVTQLATRRYDRLAEETCGGANLLVGSSESNLDWALDMAGREAVSGDVVLPAGCDVPLASPAAVHTKASELSDRGIELGAPICLCLGPFDGRHDLATVVESADRLHRIGRKDLQFVFCGEGTRSASLRRSAAKLKRVHFVNRVDAATLQALSPASVIGICAYRAGAMQGTPSEVFEYMARRMAVVSSVDGEAAQFLRRHECGVTYTAGLVNGLTNAINRIVLNPTQLESMRNQSLEVWSRNYQSSELAMQLVRHLTKLATAQRRAA